MTSERASFEYLTLNNGTKMPNFGLGTCHMHDAQVIKKTVSELGYRLYDCASFYKNEETVGTAINELMTEKVIPREELYVISKAWFDELEDLEAACKRSLEKLKVDYLDLYLVHWPFCMKQVGDKFEMVKIPMHKIWAQMEALVDKGLVKSIGLSNFNVQSTWDILTYCRIKPAVSEIELHPYNVQDNLVRFLKEYDIAPIGYCPIAKGVETLDYVIDKPNIYDNVIIQDCAKKYGKSGAQILLKWGLQRGHIVIPKSNTYSRQQENADLFNWTMEEKEIEAITKLDQGVRICDADAWMKSGSIFA